MSVQARVLGLIACTAAFFLLCGFGSDSAGRIGSDLVVTAAPVYVPLAALRGHERFPQGARLLVVHEGKSEPLVRSFAASADANVSFDATHVLFAGKKAAHDPWQIWELTLVDRALRQVTFGTEDAIRPLYLPGRRLVYAQRGIAGFQIVSAALDSSADRDPLLPLTYAAANSIPADVLADGRILFESDFPLGTGATPELFLVYADGSGVESYRCDHGVARWEGKQLSSGDVIFTHGASLGRFSSPLAHEERVAMPAARFDGAIVESKDGDWLISAKNAADSYAAIKLWKPGSSTMATVVAQGGSDLVEPVLLAPRSAPKHHPSALHPWDYANLLALDARISRDGALKGVPASVRVEMKDGNGHAVALGTSAIESDGSYFVKVPGDRPIRFAVLDAKGAMLRQEHGWFWARSGEQRICVGCHAGPEHAAENRIPAVLLRTTTPTDLSSFPSAASQPVSAGGR
ncbi:MAG TPA: hypothetical protein VHZ28_17670 [Terracidiphilus sp.]|nr:hypothetical protein [Terracidiphilus sp.]